MGQFLHPPTTNKLPEDPETSSVILYGSNATETETTIQRPLLIRHGADTTKDILDNIPVLDSRQGELSQFLSTFESYSTMYRVHKVNLVMLCFRGKAHNIISHAVARQNG